MRKDKPALIGVDWGTSSFRAYLIDREGAILDRVESDRGILSVAKGDHERVLAAALGAWAQMKERPPILLSGMIGSRQGWVEAPYTPCPAGVREVAAAIATVDAGALGKIGVAPGVLDADASTGPDVMRGEETQIFGALAAFKRTGGTFVLPGTHSKWARVEGGRIVSFATYMTGEVFAALRNHTILGRLMEAGQEDGSGFAAGVSAARQLKAPGDLLHALFMTRTLGLFDRLRPEEAPGYLSGLLIGSELLAAAPGDAGGAVVIGSPALTARYRQAGALLGLALEPAPDNCVALGQLALLGEWRGERSTD